MENRLRRHQNNKTMPFLELMNSFCPEKHSYSFSGFKTKKTKAFFLDGNERTLMGLLNSRVSLKMIPFNLLVPQFFLLGICSSKNSKIS